MPAWMVAALRSMVGISVGTPLRAGATGLGGGTLLGAITAPGVISGEGIAEVLPFRHRHRRKRLLTAQMKSDISYIAAVMGAPAAKAAMLIAVSKTG